MKIGESMSVLHSFTWNYVKYANMEAFRRDSHIIIIAYALSQYYNNKFKTNSCNSTYNDVSLNLWSFHTHHHSGGSCSEM